MSLYVFYIFVYHITSYVVCILYGMLWFRCRELKLTLCDNKEGSDTSFSASMANDISYYDIYIYIYLYLYLYIHIYTYIPGNSLWTMLKSDLLERLSDLQLGYQKVTLNHLVYTILDRANYTPHVLGPIFLTFGLSKTKTFVFQAYLFISRILTYFATCDAPADKKYTYYIYIYILKYIFLSHIHIYLFIYKHITLALEDSPQQKNTQVQHMTHFFGQDLYRTFWTWWESHLGLFYDLAHLGVLIVQLFNSLGPMCLHHCITARCGVATL